MEKVTESVSKEQLVDDFKRVVEDAEALLKATARHGGEELKEVRARAEESLRVAKARMEEEREALMVKTRDAVKAPITMSMKTHGRPSVSPRVSVC